MDDVKFGRKIDQGTGYGRPSQHSDEELVGLAPARRAAS